MKNHSLDLLGNATDSLEEALKKYREGEDGDLKAYKFAVLHMSHFIELIFKHHVSSQHRLLIYKNPFAERLDTSKTIGLWEAVNFIHNETGEISKEFRQDLQWLKGLRNQIEHFKFEMDVEEVRDAMGRVFRALLEFLDLFSDIELHHYVPADLAETFEILASEYGAKLRDALRRAEEAEEAAETRLAPDEVDDVPPFRLYCPECSNFTFIINEESASGYRCTFCDNEESDEIPVRCDNCGLLGEVGEMEVWPLDDGGSEYRCYYCSGRYHADKDD